MILRKPYAILIKHFRLIHAVMAIMMAYLAYRTNMIISFINDYISSAVVRVSSETLDNLYGSVLFLLIASVIILTIVIMIVLNVKKKPIKFYIYNIITHIYTLVIYIISAAFLNQLTHNLVEIRTLKLVSDFSTAAFLFQIAALIYVAIRAIGFDIKSFNFKEDLAELEIEEKDNEEFEVNLEVDTDKLKRNARKKIRYAKYIYVENMFFINIILSVFIVISIIFAVLNVSLYNKAYQDSQTFKTNQFMMRINESFVTETDYKGNILKKGYDLVVVRISVKKLYSRRETLNVGRFRLESGNSTYYHTMEYKNKIKDLGYTYIVNTKIGMDDFDNYVLVFEMPERSIRDKMKLKYYDTTNDEIKIDIKPVDLTNKSNGERKKINEEMNFKDSIFKNTVLKIESYEVNDSFRLAYKYCVSENDCVDSIEYVNPTASDNYNKSLLKITGTLSFDDTLPIVKYRNIYSFLNNFGTIKYVINGNTKTISGKIKTVSPKKSNPDNTYFLEVPNDLKNADKIYLEFNVRNKVYIYTLK